MADKKSPCGCGCVSMKKNSAEVAKDKKKADESK